MGNFFEKTVSDIKFWYITALILSVLTDNPAVGLALGAFIGLTVGNPASASTGKASKKLLQAAVIMLGFGMQLDVVLKVGLSSVWLTMISISATVCLGMLLAKSLSVEKNLAVLISSGTAICGGSAIAAMSPSIGAGQTETAVAMAVVFLLNGAGLIIFPPIGHAIGMTQGEFGLWSALAIHDTSSVVGAAAIFGSQALAIATTVKLTRALWILPLAFIGGKIYKTGTKAPFQWFLVGFLAAAALRMALPHFESVFNMGALVGKHMMTGTLFLIGGGLSRQGLKKIGIRPLIMALSLWIVVSAAAAFLIKNGIVTVPMM